MNRWRLFVVLGLVVGVTALAWKLDKEVKSAPSAREQTTQGPGASVAARDGRRAIGAGGDPASDSAPAGSRETAIYDPADRTFSTLENPGGPAGSDEDRGGDERPSTPWGMSVPSPFSYGDSPLVDPAVDPHTPPAPHAGEMAAEELAFRPEQGATPVPATSSPASRNGSVPSSATSPAPSPSTVTPTSPRRAEEAGLGPNGFPREHVVQEGESLWGIAGQHYDRPVLFRLILAANPELGDGEFLKVGMKLTIPAPPTAETAADQPRSATPERQEPVREGYRRYTIREGDTLYGIAARELGAAARLDEITRANPGLDPLRLFVGKVILLPK